ncbi:hypothetical protein [Demequina capsici]|uniref:DUF2975 domain-containing protein n=1 Tax=Demequina capsici TaxID=3075620 RepID=A0AA96F704_9MICO|nr:hypothetical protein [Demequina sp. OYTSA14]WNM24293.1 hypothetical protein RN606_13160 [Demequina sp. OYTSA14]
MPTRPERAALKLTAAIVLVGAVLSVGTAVHRIVEIASGEDIPVTVALAGVSVDLPLGVDGTDIGGTVESATVALHHPSGTMLATLYGEAVWWALVMTTGLVIGALLLARLARGRVFERGTIWLVGGLALLIAVHWGVSTALGAVIGIGTIDSISGSASGSLALELDFSPIVWALVLGAVAGALELGERLQQDAEGLV